MTWRDRAAILLARARMPLLYAAVALLLVGGLVGLSFWIRLAVFVVALAIVYRIGTPRGAPVEVDPPVAGRWRPVRSPADGVPSHGLHAYAQTYAFDLLDATDTVTVNAWSPFTRPPDDYASFGAPVHAVADGTVVRVSQWQRDHRSRDSIPALGLFIAESFLRELLGPAGVLGNHVVLDLGDGTFAVYAHLRSGSARVARGDRVAAGSVLAECGNSGNSTQPHLHFQVQDRRSTLIAAGRPVTFRAARDSTGRPLDVPKAEQVVQFDPPRPREPFLRL
jgi:hypothetical protein